MLFLTNTTISLVASFLMFLTKNNLCSRTQQVNAQNKPDLQNSSYYDEWNTNRDLAGILKNTTDSRIKFYEYDFEVMKEKYKKDLNPHWCLKIYQETDKLLSKTSIGLGKDVLLLKENFTKEKYEEFLKNVDSFFEKIKEFKNRNSLTFLSAFIKNFIELPERLEEIFTSDVVDEEEKKKRIKIINP